jgi:hypothetical protein
MRGVKVGARNPETGSTPNVSPFHPVLGSLIGLPSAFKDQYLTPDGRGARVVMEGEMERVWRHGRWLWPLFWLATRFEMLFPETGRHVPVLVEIHSQVTDRESIQTWQRTFEFSRTKRHFTSRMAYDRGLKRIVELVGPGKLLAVAWEMHFLPPDTLEMQAHRWIMRLGPWRFPLPALLLGSGHATERTDPAENDVIHIDLTLSHPILGDVFGYEGTFRVRREPDE